MKALFFLTLVVLAQAGCETYTECGSGFCVGPPRLEFSNLGPSESVLPHHWQRFGVYNSLGSGSDRFVPTRIDVVSHPPGAIDVEVAAVYMESLATNGESGEVIGCTGTGLFAEMSVACLIGAQVGVRSLDLEVRRSPDHSASRPAVGSLRVEADGQFFSTPIRLGPPQPFIELNDYQLLPCSASNGGIRRLTLSLRNAGAAAFHSTQLQVEYRSTNLLQPNALWALTYDGERFEFPISSGELPLVFTIWPDAAVDLELETEAFGALEPIWLTWKDASGRSWGAWAGVYDGCR